jgi:hypothetical protein
LMGLIWYILNILKVIKKDVQTTVYGMTGVHIKDI